MKVRNFQEDKKDNSKFNENHVYTEFRSSDLSLVKFVFFIFSSDGTKMSATPFPPVRALVYSTLFNDVSV